MQRKAGNRDEDLQSRPPTPVGKAKEERGVGKERLRMGADSTQVPQRNMRHTMSMRPTQVLVDLREAFVGLR